MLHQSAGYSLDCLASLYDETAAEIRAALLAEGVDVDTHPRPSPDPIAVTMERLYDLKLSIDRVGWLCGYTYGKARKILLDEGVQLRKCGPSLEREVDVPRLVKLRKSGLSIEACGRELRISSGTARNRLLAAGVSLRPEPAIFVRPPTPLPASAVVDLHRQGFKKEHVRKLTGRSSSFVQRQLALAGLPGRVRPDSLGVDTETLVAIYRCAASSQVTADVLHISKGAVLTRLWEAGQDMLDVPSPDATPVHIPAQVPWQRRQQEIVARAARGQRASEIAAALRVPVADVNAVMRVYQHRDRTTAEILYRRTQGESPGVIAVRMGLRLDRVRDVLARYTSHPRRSTPLAKPPTQ
ncbi:hypothetical protein [Streptomyces sp. BE133]|uniref:hypothetical protein n=1 Tax=Streptomyces sp. BE133 TaxID=3002523 RepID=UPI002E7848ED|nr:hypothetical protein [Streptomyces sp. BE133]